MAERELCNRYCKGSSAKLHRSPNSFVPSYDGEDHGINAGADESYPCRLMTLGHMKAERPTVLAFLLLGGYPTTDHGLSLALRKTGW